MSASATREKLNILEYLTLKSSPVLSFGENKTWKKIRLENSEFRLKICPQSVSGRNSGVRDCIRAEKSGRNSE